MTLNVEGVMRNMFRIALSLVLAIAVAYPLLFWGTATLSKNRAINVEKNDPVYSDRAS